MIVKVNETGEVILIQPTAEILYFIRPVINLKANG